MSAVDESVIRQLAELSGLALSEEELAPATAEIERLRAQIARIQAIDRPEPQRPSPVSPEPAPGRPHRIQPGLSPAEAPAAARRVASGHFAAPMGLEDSGR